MSIRIYSTEYTTPLPPGTFESLLTGLPSDIAATARRYRRWQDAYGCVFGKLLLMAALKEEGMTADLSRLQYSDHGRPFLFNAPDFNISHSAHRVACIIATHGRVGIDLEEIRQLDITDLKSQFAPEEWQSIQEAKLPLETFYRYWTAKESLSKADGRGLSLPLAALKIEDAGPIRVGERCWYLHCMTHFPGYACHVAAESPLAEVIIKAIDINELTDSVLCGYRNYPT
jgi:4'-phosphopantetheinyl transferase